MIVFMHRTDFSAVFAHLDADSTQLLCVTAVTFHVGGTEPADLGAVQIRLYAGSHVIYVLFPEARCRANVAGGCAGMAGFYALCVLWYQHDGVPPCQQLFRITQRLALSLFCAIRLMYWLVICGMWFCSHSDMATSSARIWLQTASRWAFTRAFQTALQQFLMIDCNTRVILDA